MVRILLISLGKINEGKYVWNPSICDSKIQISVDAGIVTIKGTVAWYWQRDKAEELVSDLSGMLGVKNKVAVVPTEKVVDETIAKDIVEELGRSIINLFTL